MPSLLIRNISKLLLAHDSPLGFRHGHQMADIPSIDDAYLLIEDGKISEFGPSFNCPALDIKTLDAQSGMVMPAFVDCHTHLVFADWRSSEFVDRIKGLSYLEIAARGGGILNSAQKLRLMPEEELYNRSRYLLNEVIRSGTAAIEIKSGYGLDPESEFKMLRVIRRLKESAAIPVRSTFLGAHAFPKEFKENHQGYIGQIIDVMLPHIAAEGLADYFDVFCEKGFYSLEETDQLLTAADSYGLRARIHTNQFSHSGGIGLAIRHNALSVDHLEVCDEEEIEQLSNSDTHPVLLPGASFFMNEPYQPARKMIDAGLGVILASDFNPGTCPSFNLSFIWSLACVKMKMLPEEALTALTINPAISLGLDKQCGSICKGKTANLIISKPSDELHRLPYTFGHSWISQVLVNGQADF